MFSANCAKVAKDHLRNDEHNEQLLGIGVFQQCQYPAAMKRRLVLVKR
jgi:hypothetical protein